MMPSLLLDLLPACQKKRYGLIVVPRIATKAVAYAAFHCSSGTTSERSACGHGTWATNTTPTYVNRVSVVHFSTDAYRG